MTGTGWSGSHAAARPGPIPPELSAILVVKLADVGDVLTATPALRALRQRYPRARIDLLTTPHAATVVPSGLADHVLKVPRNLVRRAGDLPSALAMLRSLRHARYDAVALLHHLTLAAGVAKYRLLAAATAAPIVAGLDNGHGGWLTHPVPDRGFGMLHEVQYALQVAGKLDAPPVGLELAARFGPADSAVASAWLAALPFPRVAIHPGSGGYALARRWEPEKWAAVGSALASRYGAAIVLVGTATDGVEDVQAALQGSCLNLAGYTSLPQLAAVLGQCNLFLGADSGVMHLACASGVPVVALFGPSNQRAWGPWTPAGQSTVVRLGLACSPCSYVGHAVGQRDGCWHRSCMADLEPSQVLAAVAALGVLPDRDHTP